MSLIIKTTTSNSSICEKINIKEETGAYSATNQGGYGVPNPLTSHVQTAKIYISKRDSTGIFSTETEIDAFGTFPSDSGANFEVDSTLYSPGFSDGIYKIRYVVAGVDGSSNAFSYESIEYVVMQCSIDCCWQKLSLEVVTCCTPEIKDKHRRIGVLMRALEASKYGNELDNIQKIIDEITSICNCSCGC